MSELKTVPFTSTGGEPIRMLPVCGLASGMGRYLIPIISEHFGMLGANSVNFGVTEQDYLYNPAGVAECIRRLTDDGLNVYVSPWAVGGVFGGEALTGGHLARARGQRFAMTHSVHQFGPRAEATLSGQDITSSVLPFLRWLTDVGADNGAVAVLFDEPRLIGPGRFGDWGINRDDLRQAVDYVRSRGLATVFVLAYVGDDDLALMRQIVAEGLADALGFTRYHAAGTYDDVPAEHYLGDAYDRMLKLPVKAGHAMAYLATVQGFDLGMRGEVIIRNAGIAQAHGISNLFVWGGPFVDEQMDTTCGDELPAQYRHYPEIGVAFNVGSTGLTWLKRMQIQGQVDKVRSEHEAHIRQLHETGA